MLLSVAFAGLTLAVSSAVSSGNSVMVFLLSSTPSTGVGASTVTAHSALALPQTAVMVAVPVFNAVTAPSFTVAILASEVVHSRESVVFSGQNRRGQLCRFIRLQRQNILVERHSRGCNSFARHFQIEIIGTPLCWVHNGHIGDFTVFCRSKRHPNSHPSKKVFPAVPPSE